MSALVRTVLGDIDPALLGRVDYHEHLFQVSPLLPGDELDDERASGEEATLLQASGFEAMVDATPFGLARDPAALARDISYFQGHGYKVEEIKAFDLFPMTHHVECVALLTR